ncbi:hypothetical protein HK097_000405, partial [Rhizophlyctis rosea]
MFTLIYTIQYASRPSRARRHCTSLNCNRTSTGICPPLINSLIPHRLLTGNCILGTIRHPSIPPTIHLAPSTRAQHTIPITTTSTNSFTTPRTVIDPNKRSALLRSAGRPGGRWTKSEEALLLLGHSRFGDNNWHRIQYHYLPNRNSNDIHRKWQLLDPTRKQGRLTTLEEAIILESLIEVGCSTTANIRSKLPDRPNVTLKGRFYEYFYPRMKQMLASQGKPSTWRAKTNPKFSPDEIAALQQLASERRHLYESGTLHAPKAPPTTFTEQENVLLKKLVSELGYYWEEISYDFPRHSGPQLRRHYLVNIHPTKSPTTGKKLSIYSLTSEENQKFLDYVRSDPRACNRVMRARSLFPQYSWASLRGRMLRWEREGLLAAPDPLRTWSTEEVQSLITAVEKHGEDSLPQIQTESFPERTLEDVKTAWFEGLKPQLGVFPVGDPEAKG